jgi:hypothetical protein
MRSEITWARKNRITPRVKYVGDANGKHWTAGKPAVLFYFVCTSLARFVKLAKNSALFLSKKSSRGSKLQHSVVEMTAHAQAATPSRLLSIPFSKILCISTPSGLMAHSNQTTG